MQKVLVYTFVSKNEVCLWQTIQQFTLIVCQIIVHMSTRTVPKTLHTKNNIYTYMDMWIAVFIHHLLGSDIALQYVMQL